VVPYRSDYWKSYAAIERRAFKMAYLASIARPSRWYLIAQTTENPVIPPRHTFSKPPVPPASSIHHGNTEELRLQSSARYHGESLFDTFHSALHTSIYSTLSPSHLNVKVRRLEQLALQQTPHMSFGDTVPVPPNLRHQDLEEVRGTLLQA
jgi:hypothetical protein